MKNTTTTTKILLFASLIATIIVPTVFDQSAFAITCPNAGLFGEDRCYAVKEFKLDVEPLNVSVDLIADDVSVGFGEGTLQNSLWTALSEGRFIEAGLQDQSSNSEKILCGQEGDIDEWDDTIAFTDGDDFNLYSIELSSGLLWKTGIKFFDPNNGSDPDPEESCTTSSPSGTYMEQILIGSEATRTGAQDYEHEWHDFEIDYSDVVVSDFWDTDLEEEGAGWEIEECGSGITNDRNFQTGKGDATAC